MKKYMVEQSGRSMIEMLGVLAIVGVLSVAGIAGYSKAMAKYKVNKLTDQVTMTAANVKTTFAGQGDYSGLTTVVAHNLGVFPEEMDKDCSGSTCTPKNAMGGDVDLKETENDKYSFDFTVSGITKDACSTLATADWGSAAGFKGIVASNIEGCDTGICTPANLQSKAITIASKLCTPATAGDDNSYSITWRFY